MERGSVLVICADLSHSCHAPIGNDPASDNRATPMTGMGRYIKAEGLRRLEAGDLALHAGQATCRQRAQTRKLCPETRRIVEHGR
jgi:hypothetical protein